MFTNYFKTALRNLWKNKLNAAINLTGLSIGLTCCLLIALYIAGELRYDRYNEHAESVWRVTRSFHSQDGADNLFLGAAAPPFGPLLKEEFPEIEEVTRLLPNTGTIRIGDRLFPEDQMFFAEQNVFDVFTIPLLAGDPRTAMDGPFQVALSESAARRLFGTVEVLDRQVGLDNQYTLRITGVYPDFPVESHWHPDYLLSFSTLKDTTVYGENNLKTNFSNNSFFTYIKVAPNFDPNRMAARFPAFLDKVVPSDGAPASVWTRLHLQRLTDIHLQSHLDSEIEPNGDIRRVRLFGVIALVILLIACINYVNLSTAFSLTRAREIGVRKAAGARRRQVIGQFLSESVLLSVAATLVAGVMTALALPLLKKALGVELAPSLLAVWYVPVVMLAAAIGVGLLAGLYPAVFLSSFKPVQVLKGELKMGKSGISLRKGLVVAQFFISIVLLVGTIVIYRQLSYLQTKSLGLDQERVVTFPSNPQLLEKWEAFRAELLNSPLVMEASRSSRLPSTRLLDNLGGTSAQIGDTLQESSASLKYIGVDFDFVPTYKLRLAAGRNFSREYSTDSLEAFLINEAALRAIGWPSAEAAVGKRLSYGGRNTARVVGVISDFHFESLHQHIAPMIFMIPRQSTGFNQVAVKVSGDTRAALAHIQSIWGRFVPDFPLDYDFLDQQYGQLYEAEQRQGRLFTVFAGLAIFIACLGLFGLVTFAAYRRTREIGIRKVLGASGVSIVGLLSREFLLLVVLAFLLAAPVAWWAMHRWLENFAYRTSVEWWMFVLAGLAATAIALFTVGYQSLRAAWSDPVKSLRSE
jgi:putative ABC transport system permease protein